MHKTKFLDAYIDERIDKANARRELTIEEAKCLAKFECTISADVR